MARALALTPHHSTAELWAHYRSCRNATEQRRTQAIALLSEGKTPGEIRQFTRLSGPAYAKIVKMYNVGGLAGLRDGRQDNPGRSPLLSDEQLSVMIRAAQQDQAQGRPWDARKLQTFVEEMIGARIHPRRSYEWLDLLKPAAQASSRSAAILKRLGLSRRP